MRVQTMYCVQGNKRLKSLAESDDIYELFADPILIESPEGGCRDPWSREDYILRAKLFFVAMLYDEYSHNEELSTFFPDSGLDVEFFDEYWNIVRIEEIQSMPEYGHALRTIGKIKRGDIVNSDNYLVENWLNEVLPI